jgi:hypothetical protein
VRAGPKAAVDGSPLPFRTRQKGAKRFAVFCRQYVIVPKGKWARQPVHLRRCQVELVGSVLDPTRRRPGGLDATAEAGLDWS